MKKTEILIVIVFLVFTKSITAQTNPLDKGDELLQAFKTGQYEISDYNTACFFALKGNKEAALVYLKKAVNDGLDNSKILAEDNDLKILHNEQEWHALMDQVKINESMNDKTANLFFNKRDFWDSKSFKTPYKENLSDEEKIAGLSKFWSEAKYNFINFDLVPSLDIDSLYFAYIPRVKQTKSTLEYYKTLMEMCAQLKDSHTNINAPGELANEIYARPLMRTRLIEDKVIIVEADKQLNESGIKQGMEIVVINNVPVKEYASKFVEPYQSASTPQDMNTRKYEYALLAGSVNELLQLTLMDERGKRATYTVGRVSNNERSQKIKYDPLEYKLLNGNITYFAINSFATDTASRFFTEHYSDIAKTNALIIDIRNNGGGNTDWTILQYLISRPYIADATYSIRYIPTYRAWNRRQSVCRNRNKIYPNGHFLFTKPVILLTSSRTFSAAEDFAAAFKALHIGVIIGEATGGSSGQPLGFILPGNGSARVCTKRDQFPDGEDFIGKGIQPDIIIRSSVADCRKGIDTQLEAALRELRK